MKSHSEITALFNLLDDPDEDVFSAVSNKIIGYGNGILPELEHLWESTLDNTTQFRIEFLMHRLRFEDIQADFKEWAHSGHHDLVLASMLAAKFIHPDISSAPVISEIERIRKSTWLELNNYLTPLEQVNVVSSILYGYFGLSGDETNYDEPNQFLIPHTLQKKKGNQISNGIIYLHICELLDIPVRAVALPNLLLLGYFKVGSTAAHLFNYRAMIEFFIDPVSGQVYTHDDIDIYMRRMNLEPNDNYFQPQTNKKVILYKLKEFSKCFQSEQENFKQEELIRLVNSLA